MDFIENLKGCDYQTAGAALIHIFKDGVIPKEIAMLLDNYVSNPCLETAIDIIKFDSKLIVFFEESKPEGFFIRYKDIMTMPLKQKLGCLAADVLQCFDHSLLGQNIVESILETYVQFCRSENAQRLSILERPVTDEIRLRLHFECLCFSTFFVSLQSSKYLSEKKWLVKELNQRLVELFDGALALALIDLCKNTGMVELREITLHAIDPKPTFVFGGHLDPLNRLEEYRTAFVKTRGSELERFGKWIGKTLDAPNYPLFEVIGSNIGELLFHLSVYSIQTA